MTLSSSRLTPGPRRPLSWVERTTGLVAFHRVLLRRTWRGEAVSRFLVDAGFLSRDAGTYWRTGGSVSDE